MPIQKWVLMNDIESRSIASAPRHRDAELTKARILDAALDEFGAHGFAGARIEEIAARTDTTKRMLFYYYESKQGLYAAVLARAYEQVRLNFLNLDLAGLHPIEAIKQVADSIFTHYQNHPEFVRLVIVENLNDAKVLKEIQAKNGFEMPSVQLLGDALKMGQERGIFRRYVDAIELQILIDSFCFFRVSNHATFDALYGRNLVDPEKDEVQRLMLQDLVVAYLTFGKVY